MMAAMWEGWKGRNIEMDKLAAENAALKDINAWCKTDAFKTCTGSLKQQNLLGAQMWIACMMQCLSQLCMRLPPRHRSHRSRSRGARS